MIFDKVLGYSMTDLLVAVRNLTIALLLAWLGFSVSPDSDDQDEAKPSSPSASAFGIITG